MRALISVAVVAALTACSPDDGDVIEPGARVRFSGTDATLTVRIADSGDEQRRGLMGVESLDEDGGMAFVYDRPTTGAFWMKDTLIPLSIAFVADDRIVAIEAGAGWFTAHGIEVGDRATLERIGYA